MRLLKTYKDSDPAPQPQGVKNRRRRVGISQPQRHRGIALQPICNRYTASPLHLYTGAGNLGLYSSLHQNPARLHYKKGKGYEVAAPYCMLPPVIRTKTMLHLVTLRSQCHDRNCTNFKPQNGNVSLIISQQFVCSTS